MYWTYYQIETLSGGQLETQLNWVEPMSLHQFQLISLVKESSLNLSQLEPIQAIKVSLNTSWAVSRA